MILFAKSRLLLIVCLITHYIGASSPVNVDRFNQICKSLREDQELQGAMKNIQDVFKTSFTLLANKIAQQCNQDEKKTAAQIFQFICSSMSDSRMRSFIVDGDMSKENKEYVDEAVVSYIFLWNILSDSIKKYVEENNITMQLCACMSTNGRINHVEDCSGYKTIDVFSAEFKEIRARIFDSVVKSLQIAAQTFDR